MIETMRLTISTLFAFLLTFIAVTNSAQAATLRYDISGTFDDQLNCCASGGTIDSFLSGFVTFDESALADDSVSSAELIDWSFDVEVVSTNSSLPGGTQRFNAANGASFFFRNPNRIDFSTPTPTIDFVIRSNDVSVLFSELDLNGPASPDRLSVNYNLGQSSPPEASGQTMLGTYVIVAQPVPLPASAWLLLGGAAALLRRRRESRGEHTFPFAKQT